MPPTWLPIFELIGGGLLLLAAAAVFFWAKRDGTTHQLSATLTRKALIEFVATLLFGGVGVGLVTAGLVGYVTRSTHDKVSFGNDVPAQVTGGAPFTVSGTATLYDGHEVWVISERDDGSYGIEGGGTPVYVNQDGIWKAQVILGATGQHEDYTLAAVVVDQPGAWRLRDAVTADRIAGRGRLRNPSGRLINLGELQSATRMIQTR